MDDRYCCEFMKQQLNYKCDQHPLPWPNNCPDVAIVKLPRGDLILVAPNAEYECNYCPSCGTKWRK